MDLVLCRGSSVGKCAQLELMFSAPEYCFIKKNNNNVYKHIYNEFIYHIKLLLAILFCRRFFA